MKSILRRPGPWLLGALAAATSIAVLSNMTHFKFRDEKVRKLLVTACLAHLDHVKAVIREIEASAT